MKRILRSLVLSLAIVVLFSVAAFTAVNHLFSHIKPKSFYSGCYKVWAHRGFFKEGLKPNSIESIAAAYDLGAAGVEIDVFYDRKTNLFGVSHDYPYNLQSGRMLMLEEVFRTVGKYGYFWLDFKNLADLTKEEAKKAVLELHALLTKYDLVQKSIVESINPFNLALASKAGLHTSCWIQPDTGPDTDFFRFRFDTFRYKLFCLYGDFSAISMDYNYFNKEVAAVFSPIPIHLFTVNDRQKLTALLDEKNVKIVLSDDKDYYSKNACGVKK
jgi:hypothetical protein